MVMTADQFDKWVRPEDMIHPLPIDSEEARAIGSAGSTAKRRKRP